MNQCYYEFITRINSFARVMCLLVIVYMYPVNPLALWFARSRLIFLACIMIELTPQCDKEL